MPGALSARKVKGRVYVAPGSPNTLIIVEDGRGLVVDPGLPPERGRGLAELLRGLGVEKLEAIVLTHGHSDHLAAAPELAEETRAPIAATRLCRGLVEDSRLRRLVVYGGVVSASTAAMPLVEPHVDVEISGGDELGLGARALPTPGHTPGHVAVVAEEEQVVAAGDAVLGEKVLARFGVPFAAELRGWRESLGVLRELALQGYTVVPGHGPVTRGKRAAAMIDKNIEAVDKVYRYVLEKIAGGPVTLDKLAYMATVELGSAEPTPRQLLLNRTALASVLAWLEEEGLAEPVSTPDGPAWRRRAA